MNWDELHKQERHQLRVPSEHVTRFLVGVKKGGAKTVLDIGCGQGRHMKLARDLGFTVTGVDSSLQAATAANEFGTTHVATMDKLSYADEEFDCAISTGVFYYGALEELEAAVLEMRRVVKPDGWCFVSLKTTRDWRRGSGFRTWLPAGEGFLMAEDTFRLCIPGEPEHDMTLTFLSSQEVGRIFGGVFREAKVELAEFTTMNRLRINSDWLVTAWR